MKKDFSPFVPCCRRLAAQLLRLRRLPPAPRLLPPLPVPPLHPQPQALLPCSGRCGIRSPPHWQAMADGYMASHRDVTIEMVDLGSSDYMTVLATQLAGSADLDVVTVKDIPGYANLINLDYLKPLNEVLTRDAGDFNGTIEQLTTDDGNFYAVPFRSDFWVLYYNKDLFDKAGVEYPSNDLTMEDYDALARKMTSGSGDTKVYGCHYHTWRLPLLCSPFWTARTPSSTATTTS